MNSDLRMQLQIARTGQHGDIMRTTLFALAAIAGLIGFGATGVAIPLIVLTVAVTAYGILAGAAALDDISALRDDMDEATGGSAYGRQAKARDLGQLKLLSSGLLGVTGATLLLAILF